MMDGGCFCVLVAFISYFILPCDSYSRDSPSRFRGLLSQVSSRGFDLAIRAHLDTLHSVYHYSKFGRSTSNGRRSLLYCSDAIENAAEREESVNNDNCAGEQQSPDDPQVYTAIPSGHIRTTGLRYENRVSEEADADADDDGVFSSSDVSERIMKASQKAREKRLRKWRRSSGSANNSGGILGAGGMINFSDTTEKCLLVAVSSTSGALMEKRKQISSSQQPQQQQHQDQRNQDHVTGAAVTTETTDETDWVEVEGVGKERKRSNNGLIPASQTTTSVRKRYESEFPSSNADMRSKDSDNDALTLQFSTEESLLELSELVTTAGLDVCGCSVQRLTSPHIKTYIGPGKVMEVFALAMRTGARTIVVDGDLTPTQQRNLESALLQQAANEASMYEADGGDRSASAEAMSIKVLDRTAVILEIFAQRAKTREGQLQVELAMLQYRLASRGPKAGGAIDGPGRGESGCGFRGPGESKLETDKRVIRFRIVQLTREIEQLKQQREQQRSSRRRLGLPLVALVGYTNAGKSSLLNSLCDPGAPIPTTRISTPPTTHTLSPSPSAEEEHESNENDQLMAENQSETASKDAGKADKKREIEKESTVFAEDMLFATLDPTTRRVLLPKRRDLEASLDQGETAVLQVENEGVQGRSSDSSGSGRRRGQELLLTDTVGFISKLPTDLIAAFRATLEEVGMADVLVHVIDRSHPQWRKQRAAVMRELDAIPGTANTPLVEFWNKLDLVTHADDEDSPPLSVDEEEEGQKIEKGATQEVVNAVRKQAASVPIDTETVFLGSFSPTDDLFSAQSPTEPEGTVIITPTSVVEKLSYGSDEQDYGFLNGNSNNNGGSGNSGSPAGSRKSRRKGSSDVEDDQFFEWSEDEVYVRDTRIDVDNQGDGSSSSSNSNRAGNISQLGGRTAGHGAKKKKKNKKQNATKLAKIAKSASLPPGNRQDLADADAGILSPEEMRALNSFLSEPIDFSAIQPTKSEPKIPPTTTKKEQVWEPNSDATKKEKEKQYNVENEKDAPQRRIQEEEISDLIESDLPFSQSGTVTQANSEQSTAVRNRPNRRIFTVAGSVQTGLFMDDFYDAVESALSLYLVPLHVFIPYSVPAAAAYDDVRGQMSMGGGKQDKIQTFAEEKVDFGDKNEDSFPSTSYTVDDRRLGGAAAAAAAAQRLVAQVHYQGVVDDIVYTAEGVEVKCRVPADGGVHGSALFAQLKKFELS